MKVLIVEDDPFVAEDVKDNIEKLGYHVTAVAESYENALEAIGLRKPDLALLDIELKGPLSGIDLSYKLAEMEIPFIYLSSMQDISTYQLAKSSGPARNLSKPIDPINLRNALDEAFSAVKVVKRKESSQYFVNIGDGERIHLNVDNLVYMEAYGNSCKLFFKDKSRKVATSPMGNVFEKLCADKRMIQIHRSFCINVEHVESYSGNQVKMVSFNEKLTITEKYKTRFLQNHISI